MENSIVKDMQIANKVKSKLKKLLKQLDTTKQGYIQVDAFFQMLELHEIKLAAEDKQKLKQLCQIKGTQIKYTDALALIQVNRDVHADGTPVRQDQGFWILQIPQRSAQRAKASGAGGANSDTKSIVSTMSSVYSDVSIDPVIRQKAERILVNTNNGLAVIAEEGPGGKLTMEKLQTLGEAPSKYENQGVAVKSTMSRSHSTKKVEMETKSRRVADIFETKSHRFEDSSNIDQDDSYGNYRPAFLIKKHKVAGRTEEIMKLQRMASLDRDRALLAPVQPDLSGEKAQNRRMYAETDAYRLHDHITHPILDKLGKMTDGSPSPQPEHFFRKAKDMYMHNESPDGKVTDASAARLKISMERPNQPSDVATKTKVSPEYLKNLIDNKNLGESKIKLLISFIENKIDYRTLLTLKNQLFDVETGEGGNRDEIPIAQWKPVSERFLHIFPKSVEDQLLAEICVGEGASAHISRTKYTDLLDAYQFLPIKIKRDKNKSESVYYVLNSNMRGQYQSRDEILQSLKYENDRKHLTKIMTLIAIKIEEKFITLGKGFLFFDLDGDHAINRQEFHKGIDAMRVKLAKGDVDQVFDHMDADGDGCLSYTEFCGFAEEKRRNIDPFDAIDLQKAGKLGLNESALAALQNPYGNIQGTGQKSDAMSRSLGGSGAGQKPGQYEDLESQAADMNIINNGRINKQRKGGIPASVKNNKDFTFGVRSDNDFPSGASPKPGVYVPGHGSSSMHKIMGHSQNMVDDLLKKIHLKQNFSNMSTKGSQHKSNKTNDLRSKSVLQQKQIRDLKQNGYESQRDFTIGQDLLLPQIEQSFIQINNSTVQPSNRMVPRQMSQMTKKNNALIHAHLQSNQPHQKLDMEMEKFYKTDDSRMRATPIQNSRLTKGEKDDLVSNYFTDKRKLGK